MVAAVMYLILSAVITALISTGEWYVNLSARYAKKLHKGAKA